MANRQVKVVNGKIVDQKDIYIKWDTDLKISDDAARITRYDQKKIDRQRKTRGYICGCGRMARFM